MLPVNLSFHFLFLAIPQYSFLTLIYQWRPPRRPKLSRYQGFIGLDFLCLVTTCLQVGLAE